MKKKFLLLAAAVMIVALIQLQSQENSNAQKWYALFNKAEALFNGEATEATDSAALNYYTRVVRQLKVSQANALILYNCYERIGILKQGLGFNARDALAEYYAAFDLHKNYHLSDSLLFRLLLAVGNVHYMEGRFDSSVYYLSMAENVIDKYPAAGLAGDLYNSLGALYSESGNYMQSGSYFSKALEITKKTRPDLKEAIFAMSANIATSLRLSGHVDDALKYYKKLLDPNAPSFPLLNNISGIYLTKKMPDSALYYLQLAKSISGSYAINYYNSVAQAYMLKADMSSTAINLGKAKDIYMANGIKVRNNSYAATCKYTGDLRMLEHKPTDALRWYQQAIIQYNFKFGDTSVYANPGNFIGDFANYNLFDALTAKADCFATLYSQEKNEQYFTAAKSTYDSAFALADYIKKSIDNDEARLFIADKVFGAYSKAVDFILAANNKHDKTLTVHALEWISKSRATSLAISLKENTVKQYAGIPDSLLSKEKNIKVNISRLKLQLQQAADSSTQSQLLSAINTAVLELQSLNNTYKQFPTYYKQKFAADNIDINSIQKNVLNNNIAVICYYKGTQQMKAFVITHNNIVDESLNYDTNLQQNITAYMQSLSENNNGRAYNASPSMYLYDVLIKPLLKNIAGIKSLIIIPDSELINVPFEAFQPTTDKFLVEDYAITYQYALPFLQKGGMIFNKTHALALAPFASKNNNTQMEVLPFSATEIENFPRQSQLINEAATKNNFLLKAEHASVIHLATHAVVNYDEPADSYIAFYENANTDSSYKIFAHELYNLQLPNTKLVFLSACETGTGKISQSEGALSLSRAFAFAGCPNIITSVWKAEDRSTAYISKQFYVYAEKGYTYAEALQQAKKDLLADAAMSQFHAPQYWSHLIFIGDVQQQKTNMFLWIITAAVSVIVLLIVIGLYKKKYRNIS